MTFSTSIFLIGLLPWFVIAYNMLGKGNIWTRSIILILANCLFIIWGGLASFLMLTVGAVLVWIFSAVIFQKRTKWVLALCLFLTSMPLVLMKYTRFAIANINALMGSDIQVSPIVVPMGISFVTFEAISLLADIYKGKIERCPNIIETYLYLTFFPTISSGPIIRFNEFETGLKRKSFSCDFPAAIERIVFGLSKKILIADKLAILVDYYYDGVSAGFNYSAIGLWLGSIAYTLQLYFDFSGYSDMAIGIGQLLGFDIRENFAAPYQASSISMFWKRWHMSLTQWFRDYIYIPLGGNRCSAARHIVNMLIVWLLTGLWHGADWSFLIWGIGYFVLLVAEKYIPAMTKMIKGIPGHIYTLFFVNLLWVPFRANNLNTTAAYIRGMFGGGIASLENRAVRFIPLIVLACLLCFQWNGVLERVSKNIGFRIIRGIAFIAIAFVTLCAALNSSYAPYIYGNF